MNGGQDFISFSFDLSTDHRVISVGLCASAFSLHIVNKLETTNTSNVAKGHTTDVSDQI
jgi:hypothetical protein